MSIRRDQKQSWVANAEAIKGAELLSKGRTPTPAQTVALEACGVWAKAVQEKRPANSSKKSGTRSTSAKGTSKGRGTGSAKKASRRS